MKWTKKSDEELIKLIKKGVSYKEVSILFNTTVGSIRGRCFNIGIKSSDFLIQKKRYKMFRV